MAEVKWTTDQQKAIACRRGTLLVSAAAGSGKTAVLVERIIQRLTDAEDPCSVEELLVVTFTKAAAAQMKKKIADAITEKIARDPANGDLRRQQMLLPLSRICTIDSFCINLVRDNFHALGVSPDFALLDENKLKILENDAVNSVLEELYKENSDGFARLCSLICDKRDDSALSNAVLKLYNIAQAYPFPADWLNDLEQSFLEEKPLTQTIWGKQIVAYGSKVLDYGISLMQGARKAIEGDAVIAEKFCAYIAKEIAFLESLRNALYTSSWDELRMLFCKVNFETIPSAPRGYKSAEKELFKTLHDEMKKAVRALGELFPITQEEHEKDLAYLRPAVSALTDAVRRFSVEFSALKKAENGVDFSDTLHLAIVLLAQKKEDGSVVPTGVAQEQATLYKEILIDEYQDVNEAQDIIFNLISRDGNNLFMVGDVKQSIYGFRMAMPEIFLEKRERYPLYENENYPATVVLGRNFRSRQGVTENVNFIFNRLMTKGLGGLEYGKSDYLYHNPEGYLPHDSADAELHILTQKGEEWEKAEAVYIADYIEKNRGTLLVKSGSSQRPAEYGDFCVLYRAMTEPSKALSAELESRGIPVVCDVQGSFFEAPEIRFMLSLMRVLDNPVDDISLLTVMLSPVFGFTPDELAAMRAAMDKGNLYHCLVYAKKRGNPKAIKFLEETEKLRRVANTVSAAALVNRLLEETGYAQVVSAMKDAALRRANLRLLADFAARYEATGRVGPAGFLRYVDRAEKSGVKIKGADNGAEGADAVKIMTIHKSKGLEFPVVILGGCGSQMNTVDQKQNIIVSGKCGFGVRSADETGFVRYDTVPLLAAKIELKEAQRAEELRVLYVALTRAKERLAVVGTVKGKSDLKRVQYAVNEKISPCAVMGAMSYLQLLCMAWGAHPDAVALRSFAGGEHIPVMHGAEKLKVFLCDGVQKQEVQQEVPQQKQDTAALRALLQKRLSYSYPYGDLNGVPAKRVASDFAESAERMEFFASARPAFMSKKQLTPSQRGTATHKFVQFADLQTRDVQGELQRLCRENLLTEQEAQAVDLQKAQAFLQSDLTARMLRADALFREKSFTCALPAGELDPAVKGESAKEEIVIDGIADCAFAEQGELVVVDYKTDSKVTEEELIFRYAGQLKVYRRCLSAVLGMPVKETLIYSFYLGKTVSVE